MPKQIMALILVLLFCACPFSATSDLLQPTCSNICRSYARDDLNYRYCVLACKSKANLDNVVDSYNPSELLPDYFQNGERVPMEKGSESKTIDFYNPAEDSRGRVGESYETWSPTVAGSVSKRSNAVIWRKAAESEPPHDQGMSFIRIGRPAFLLGKLPVSEVQRRASSFVRIGRVPPYARYTGGQGEAFIQELEKTIAEDEASGDPTMELEGDRPSFDFESDKPLMEEREGKRASSFVRIGRSHVDSNSNKGSFHSMNNDGEDKRASSFVRIGRSRLDDDDEMRARSFLEMVKSPVEVESMPRSVSRVRKSLTENEKKRASSFVRIGKSHIDEVDKRASSFVRIGKSHLDEVDKRASSFVRIGKSQLDEADKRASSFVRIGKSPIDEADKRASSFVRIGKSHLDEADKRASSFVRIGKSPTLEDEKRASSFVRIGKSHLDKVDKRASSFVRIGKSHIDEADKRASSFVRIGKSPLNEDEKRASSFVRIGKSPSYEDNKRASSFVRIGKSRLHDEDKRASSFVRIGKSLQDEENESASFAEIGKPNSSAYKRDAGSLLRNKKRPVGYESQKRAAGSSTVGAGSSAEPDSDEFQMNGHHQGKHYSAYWRLRIPSPSKGDDEPNDRSLLRIPRPVVQSLQDQDAGVASLLPSQKTDQVLWIPVTDD